MLGEKAHPASLQFETVGGEGFPLCAAARDALSEHSEWGFLSILGGSKSLAANGNQIAAEFTVEPQSTAKLTVLLGFEQFERIPKLIADADAEAALKETMRFYRQKTDMLRIKTGDASFDALVNGRLLYQTYSARIIGRTGFWQCGGAFGFRDQLQDAAALAATDPECTRNMIIKCASRQFKKGDVLHWWHEGFADGLPRGVRTMISDDRLFLPLAACEYAEVSGDAAIFDEQIPYLADMKIPYGQQNIYCEMERSDDTETLYEHWYGSFSYILFLPFLYSFSADKSVGDSYGDVDFVFCGSYACPDSFFFPSIWLCFRGRCSAKCSEQSSLLDRRTANVLYRSALDRSLGDYAVLSFSIVFVSEFGYPNCSQHILSALLPVVADHLSYDFRQPVFSSARHCFL